MTLVLQGVVSGLLFGGVYSLMAVGMTLLSLQLLLQVAVPLRGRRAAK